MNDDVLGDTWLSLIHTASSYTYLVNIEHSRLDTNRVGHMFERGSLN